ncbi:MAG: hypothetical protein UU73_C0005G0007 [Candidatus Daviesbacteria bacterium GW2011_GWA1_41_61]|uniref:Uncharacterized protein n=1 Tax=Candidatus Daviesbacteria bacterium GW2011_GWA2_40_9 TaxID=1618424 RepID=A0A0G0U3N4_9BACT|nr:MAG: hypothetical protein UU26_C0012G0021 [Candidatus Daviesbacteria bacterium GW2011_GWC1_40_9]KKR83664.1 MAG: hypothetical protein UU29_C0003G0066 [Candidatus Daviesbacteria bacterium GW2011_GWA2_40_9]KKR92677.1 MAG: hypothetical protein UU44_C0005G0007 [Candidatus Daviesbacteria bacterium GW2011_GWB1_41_15]KKS14608.1 MAG: hypothetical protein UU73_C0005G0007 [Candidatus Daviesbacteria bacterium GW2011_GWA1_41_61]
MITVDEMVESGECPCEVCSSQDATFRAPKNKTYPCLEPEEVQEFKKLVKEVYQIELSDEVARDQGSRLIQLFELQIQNKKSDFKKELEDGTT